MTIRCLAMGAALVLAGCGGSSTSGGPDFSELSDAFDAMNTRITALPDAATLPVGSASYAGMTRLDVQGAEARVLIGDATLSADFASGSVSGALSGFVDSRGDAVTGAIALTGGTVTAAFINGLAVNGDLDVGGRTLAFRGTGGGKFTGATGEAAIIQMGGVSGGPGQPDWQGDAFLDRR